MKLFFQKFHFQKLFIPPGHVGDISAEFNRGTPSQPQFLKVVTPPQPPSARKTTTSGGGVFSFLLNSAEISPTCPGGMNNF